MNKGDHEQTIRSFRNQLISPKLYYYKARKLSNSWACQYWYYHDGNMFNANWGIARVLKCSRLKDGCINGDPDLIIESLIRIMGIPIKASKLY